MAARVMKPTAKTKIPVKASGSVSVSKKRAEKVAIVAKVLHAPVKTKTVVVKLKKSREPKDTHIAITNNTQKVSTSVTVTKAKTEQTTKVTKKTARVISTAVIPKPAILSPFRFPVLSPNRLPIVARIAGFVFLFVGAFFSLLNTPLSNDAILSFIGETQIATVTEPLSTTANQSTSNASGVDTTPDPNISIEGIIPLSGVVPITIGVPDATSVKVILDNRDSGQLIVLGMAMKVDAGTWRFYWQTSQFSDAEYRIKVVVINPYTTYDYTDSETYEVHNVLTTLTDSSTDASNISTSTNTNPEPTISTTTSATSNTTVSFYTSQSGTISDDVEFKILVANASKVTIHARNVSTNVLYYVGQTTNKGSNEWGLDWDSSKLPDGTYNFYVVAIIDGLSFESTRAKLVLDNDIAIEDIEDSVATSTDNAETTDVIPFLEPSIVLSLGKESPLSGFVEIDITTSPVQWVELYATPKSSLTTRFLGLATKRSDTSWTYEWNSTQVPNGYYSIHARVKSIYGFSEGVRKEVKVLNQVMEALTPNQEELVDKLQSVTTDLITTTEGSTDDVSDNAVYVESVDSFVSNVNSSDEERERIEEILNAFRKSLETHLDALARAERVSDVDSVRKAKEAIESLKSEVINALPTSVQKKELIDQINTYLSQITYELQQLTIRNETILKERVGTAITNDSDKDGVSDYDEVNLYNTNPFAADTDGDGFIDSAEITLGYNPHDSTPEALVTYQSPKETGVVREDLLKIETLTTLTPSSLEEKPRAFISGSALPNSFVTLYIYSTPIVVTIKTSADGGWSYIFDKEIEDGEHEIYVGMTDNAGNIVAKSNPLPFVKTAEAYTATDMRSAALEAEHIKPSLFNEKSLLLIASLIVVALGLVLLLLGAFARNKKSLTDIAPVP